MLPMYVGGNLIYITAVTLANLQAVSSPIHQLYRTQVIRIQYLIYLRIYINYYSMVSCYFTVCCKVYCLFKTYLIFKHYLKDKKIFLTDSLIESAYLYEDTAEIHSADDLTVNICPTTRCNKGTYYFVFGFASQQSVINKVNERL